jgi:methylphosphotriester-DNA--protein-cysteine methyltransferase
MFKTGPSKASTQVNNWLRAVYQLPRLRICIGGPIMIACDTSQLHRIERRIAALEPRPVADQIRLQRMREALRLEKRRLLGLDLSARSPPFTKVIIPAIND